MLSRTNSRAFIRARVIVLAWVDTLVATTRQQPFQGLLAAGLPLEFTPCDIGLFDPATTVLDRNMAAIIAISWAAAV